MLYQKTVTMIVFVVLVAACAGNQPNQTLSQLPAYKVEKLDPPTEEKNAAKLPPKQGKPTALDKDSKAPFVGILIDSYLLAKYKMIQAERDRLRSWITIERTARGDVQALMNRVLVDALARSELGWWERNKGLIGFAVGVIAASALAIGLTAGLDHVQR